jgi:hypothetical protein
MIHISALHGNLILAAIGRIAVQHPNELAIRSMSYGQLASNVLSSASNLLSASLSDGMLGGYDLEEETVTMPGLAWMPKSWAYWLRGLQEASAHRVILPTDRTFRTCPSCFTIHRACRMMKRIGLTD